MSEPEGLEERFRMPSGFNWGSFITDAGTAIRFGTVSPPNPDAVVVCLQGLSEFTEKYFEFARELVSRNYAFWMMDWKGQGKSQRNAKDPMRRHASDFRGDVQDLSDFITRHVQPGANGKPLVMFGHSMGGNIGLRYLAQHPHVFRCAAFTAPMLGINPVGNLPAVMSVALTKIFSTFLPFHYVPTGQKEWRPAPRPDIFSSDPVRKLVHNKWFEAEPGLQVGNVTYGWLHAANTSCILLQKRESADRIITPCLIALAGEDRLVLNGAARALARKLPHAQLLELPEAKHEIMMERDGLRDMFLHGFFDLIRKSA